MTKVAYKGIVYSENQNPVHAGAVPHEKCKDGTHWNEKRHQCMEIPPRLQRRIDRANEKSNKANSESSWKLNNADHHARCCERHMDAFDAHDTVSYKAGKKGFSELAEHHKQIAKGHGDKYDHHEDELQKAIDEEKAKKRAEGMVSYRGGIYVESAQRNPHRPMTSTERTQMRQTLKNRRPARKQLQSFSAPMWRSIAGKTHKGCWESTFTYKIMGGPSANKSSNFTRCVGFDKTKKPQLKKNPGKPSGFEVVKKEE